MITNKQIVRDHLTRAFRLAEEAGEDLEEIWAEVAEGINQGTEEFDFLSGIDGVMIVYDKKRKNLLIEIETGEKERTFSCIDAIRLKSFLNKYY
jgi:hypothetical protein